MTDDIGHEPADAGRLQQQRCPHCHHDWHGLYCQSGDAAWAHRRTWTAPMPSAQCRCKTSLDLP